ncbi:MAG: hypothetical protein A2275_05935 [Bacteroidetes bacterium RIFOXYA12_FULL_35_11]|nr:MAG: hypothetical protein A2X01_20165 [Bacteroidetes bacterium GWF2_35_48]OFY75502.1 MAG: hypothetical protein A2275_05935 [Bacteroidetes bacterium RIFOXYA12_FULL_35_11]HBX52848.1 hypothetical protein [Bacteroidales bacterium]
MRHYIIILFLFISISSIAGRDSIPNFFIKGKFGYGALIRHRESMGNLMRHVGSMQIELGRQTNGIDLWEQLYRYPEYGAGYYFANLGDPKLLGQVHALYAYLNSPFYRTKKFSLNYHFAIGASYITRKWDYKENYMNLAIGTHLNVYFNVHLNAAYRINKKIEIIGGIGACHYSNGAIAQPNLGINVANADIGLRYYFNEYEEEFNKLEIPSCIKKNEFTVLYAVGTKSIPPPRGSNFFMSSLSLCFSRQINHKRKIGGGTDIFYDETVYEESSKEEVRFKNALRNGIYVSHEFLIKKFSIGANLGIYTWYTEEPFFPLYTRLYFRYNVSKNFFTNISLKAHLGVADYIEWGLGYRFIK